MKTLTLADYLIFTGLLALGVGLGLYKLWLSLTVVGGIMLALGLLGSLRGGK